MTASSEHGAPSTSPTATDLAERFSRFTEHWAPKRIASVNDYDVKIVKVQGEFVWHSHPDTDELFLVVAGNLTIGLRRAGSEPLTVALGPGQLYVVPRGVEHCPMADDEASVVLFEPTGTPNTGDAGGERTREAEELTD